METKAHIRERILALRNDLPVTERQEASAKIAEKVFNLNAYKKADIVLGFVGYGSETDTVPFLESAVKDGKKVYCPVSKGNGTMEFYRFRRKEDLTEGYKKIPEPSGTEERFDSRLAEKEKHLHVFMLMPGVAFDEKGHRIGYGKGFYDRYLGAFRPECVLAVCFECQMVEEIPAEEFDVLPDLVVTEKRVIGVCSGRWDDRVKKEGV